jgi:hypothetical protein
MESRSVDRVLVGCRFGRGGISFDGEVNSATLESKRVDEFANMSDEELERYVYGSKELDS